jgi:alkylation response protein AidB-like acyl-CoA dehydrogenase
MSTVSEPVVNGSAGTTAATGAATDAVPDRLADPAAALAAAGALAPALAERAAAHDRAGTFPADDFADLRRTGLLGLMVPTRLGGPGAGFADYAEVAMALAAGNGATALVYNMHASVTGALAQTPDGVARALGVPESYFAMRDRALTQAAEGGLFAVAMSERGAGSRLSKLTTEYAEVDGGVDGGFRIRGAKTFVSGAGHADIYLVAARAAAAAAAAGPPTVSYFLVPAGPGVTVERTWDSLGMRATGSDDLHLDVLVGPDALLGGIEGLTLLLAQVMPQWLVASYAAVYVGEAASRVDAAAGEPETNRWVWRAKLLAGETAMDVAASMLEAAGTSASRRGHPLERIYRDARCGSLQPATSDVCADWLGLAALGLDPEQDAEVSRW